MAIYKLAVEIILVHNHPSDSPDISKSDRDFTDRMLKVGALFGYFTSILLNQKSSD